ncbi:MAG TPA: hypothetical protein VGK99_03485 [Acidobacteriota bacterium]|jgi:hypothetical protein
MQEINQKRGDFEMTPGLTRTGKPIALFLSIWLLAAAFVAAAEQGRTGRSADGESSLLPPLSAMMKRDLGEREPDENGPWTPRMLKLAGSPGMLQPPDRKNS